MNLSQKAQEMINFWIDPRNIPFKSSLIDFESIDGNNTPCMCAQGQTLYRNGYTVEQLINMEQSEADKETAKILGISVSHSRLLRIINDKEEGAPQDVLTNPQKYLGPRYENVLDFWLKLDEISKEQWRVVNERYYAFFNENSSEWYKAADLTIEASKEAVGEYYANEAGNAVWGVTISDAVFYATTELIGGVENPVCVPMFDNL